MALIRINYLKWLKAQTLQVYISVIKQRRFKSYRLEVRKDNHKAFKLYQKPGFQEIEDRGDKILMQMQIEITWKYHQNRIFSLII